MSTPSTSSERGRVPPLGLSLTTDLQSVVDVIFAAHVTEYHFEEADMVF